MENKQTAVEWLIVQLKKVDYNPLEQNGYSKAEERLFDQAKEMEKKQMKDAVLSQCTTHEGLRKIFDKQFEQYYNETYGKGSKK